MAHGKVGRNSLAQERRLMLFGRSGMKEALQQMHASRERASSLAQAMFPPGSTVYRANAATGTVFVYSVVRHAFTESMLQVHVITRFANSQEGRVFDSDELLTQTEYDDWRAKHG